MSSRGRNLSSALKRLQVAEDEDASWQNSAWLNRDIVPLPPERRTWGPLSFVGFWLTTGVNISGWAGPSALISLGLNVPQAMAANIVGNIIVAIAVVGTGAPGAKWHIPFSPIQRHVWGLRGSFFPLINRIILSFTWFSTQAYFGARSTRVLIGSIWPTFYDLDRPLAGGSLDVSTLIAFVIFYLISLPLIWLPPEFYRIPFAAASASITVAALSILGWALGSAQGPGALVKSTAALAGVPQATGSKLTWAIIYGISSTIGGICAGLLSQSDYTRYARRPTDQIVSQLFVIPVSAIMTAAIGILTTSCAAQLYPDEGLLWQPYDLLFAIQKHGGSRARAGVFFASLAFVCAQLGINVAGNAISGGIDLSGLLPRWFNIRRGGYFTAAIALLLQPWQLLNGSSVYISVMGGYAVFLGPLTGAQIAELRLSHLYEPSERSIYWFWRGINWRAIVAWSLGVWPSMPGFIATIRKTTATTGKGWMHAYYLCWPMGFAISFSIFCLLNWLSPPKGIGEVDEVDVFGTFGPAEHVPEEVVDPDEKQVVQDATPKW